MASSDRASTRNRAAVGLVLAYEPCPAVAVDRNWNLVAANDATTPLSAAVTDAVLLEPPINLLRASLHPDGIALLILRNEEWPRDILRRLSAQLEASGDPGIAELMTELRERTGIAPGHESRERAWQGVRAAQAATARVASFISTTTPTEITLSELVIEAFLPAGAATTALLAASAR
ncbi:MmyB family transcriptional regulator [Mesorhizobium sp. BHbsci]